MPADEVLKEVKGTLATRWKHHKKLMGVDVRLEPRKGCTDSVVVRHESGSILAEDNYSERNGMCRDKDVAARKVFVRSHIASEN